MKPNLTCVKCGSTEYYTELKSNNNVARCSECDAFIKNIPYQTESILYFGKYKGTAVKDIEDMDYLKWVLANTKQSERMRNDINERIEKFEHLAK